MIVREYFLSGLKILCRKSANCTMENAKDDGTTCCKGGSLDWSDNQTCLSWNSLTARCYYLGNILISSWLRRWAEGLFAMTVWSYQEVSCLCYPDHFPSRHLSNCCSCLWNCVRECRMPLLETLVTKTMICWEAPHSRNTALNNYNFHPYNNTYFPMLVLLPCSILFFYV